MIWIDFLFDFKISTFLYLEINVRIIFPLKNAARLTRAVVLPIILCLYVQFLFLNKKTAK